MAKIDKIEYTSKTKVQLSSGQTYIVEDNDYFYDTKDNKAKFNVLTEKTQEFCRRHFAKKQIENVLNKIPLQHLTTYAETTTEDEKFEHELYLYSHSKIKYCMVNGELKTKYMYEHTYLVPSDFRSADVVRALLYKKLKREFVDKLSIYTDYNGISVYIHSNKYKRIFKDNSKDCISYALNIDSLLDGVTSEDIDNAVNSVDLDHFYRYNFKTTLRLKREVKELLKDIKK